MEWKELLIEGYKDVLKVLEEALDGLSADDLNQQPNLACNSIGWISWHLTRVQDNDIADLMGEEQLWVSDGWHARFNRPDQPNETGFGHSSEDVAAFESPNVETLLGYHRVVLERSKHYIANLSVADLDREVNKPWLKPFPTVGVNLVHLMSDNLQHAGQVAYLRGLLKGKGWSSE